MKTEDGRSIDEMNLIHSLGIDDNSGTVSIKLNLTKDYRKAKSLITKKLQSEISWVKNVKIEMAPQEKKAENQRTKGLVDVQNIIAVSSCKGGVGKSTVAVNLAFSLQKLGLNVGIFDADIYGPSLPTMVSPDQDQLYQDEHDPAMIQPVMFSGMKCMSYGFANSGKGSIMRGPMVSNLVVQLIGQTRWGPLDYLVIDFPPGTGDI